MLGDVLRELKKGRSHMALVRDVNDGGEEQVPAVNQLRGIITLEDIVEEILGRSSRFVDFLRTESKGTHLLFLPSTKPGDEIVDETDAAEKTKGGYEDREEKLRWARLRLLDAKIVEQNLSPDETHAVAAHLSLNHPTVVSLLTENQLYKLIAETPVTVLPVAQQKVGQSLPVDLLYQKGAKTDFATLILAGRVTVDSGADHFHTTVSNWSLLGRGALTDTNYTPDFSAFVSAGPCRCILLKRAKFAAAVDASTLERQAKKRDNQSSDKSATETTSLLGNIV